MPDEDEDESDSEYGSSGVFSEDILNVMNHVRITFMNTQQFALIFLSLYETEIYITKFKLQL